MYSVLRKRTVANWGNQDHRVVEVLVRQIPMDRRRTDPWWVGCSGVGDMRSVPFHTPATFHLQKIRRRTPLIALLHSIVTAGILLLESGSIDCEWFLSTSRDVNQITHRDQFWRACCCIAEERERGEIKKNKIKIKKRRKRQYAEDRGMNMIPPQQRCGWDDISKGCSATAAEISIHRNFLFISLIIPFALFFWFGLSME